ncbi:hypothetical protein LCGC14_1140970, partial [marine sediment metagenome]
TGTLSVVEIQGSFPSGCGASALVASVLPSPSVRTRNASTAARVSSSLLLSSITRDKISSRAGDDGDVVVVVVFVGAFTFEGLHIGAFLSLFVRDNGIRLAHRDPG